MKSYQCFAASLILTGSVMAQEQAASAPWLIRGFGTVSATRTSEPGTGYVSYPQNISRATRNDWTLASDSLVGVQLDLRAAQPLSATAQVIARHRARDRIEPLLEWGFVKYQPDGNWTILVGRQLTPVQMDAENRFVGYANTTVRADVSAYSLYPLSNHDGVSVSYERMLGDTHLEWMGYAGRASMELPGDADGQSVFRYRADLVRGLRLSVAHGGLTVRASYTAFDDYVDGPPTEFFRQMLNEARWAQAGGCGSCGQAADALQNTLTDMGSALLDIGFRYDAAPYALWGEYFTNSARASLRSSYHGVALGASIRRGKLTPYITYGRQLLLKINTHPISDADLPGLSPRMRAFNQAPVFPSNSARHNWAIGTRYEITRSVALKAEMLRVSLDDPSRANPTPFPKLSPTSEPRTRSFGLYTLALDFVF